MSIIKKTPVLRLPEVVSASKSLIMCGVNQDRARRQSQPQGRYDTFPRKHTYAVNGHFNNLLHLRMYENVGISHKNVHGAHYI
jgi:hypothetical protein